MVEVDWSTHLEFECLLDAFGEVKGRRFRLRSFGSNLMTFFANSTPLFLLKLIRKLV